MSHAEQNYSGLLLLQWVLYVGPRRHHTVHFWVVSDKGFNKNAPMSNPDGLPGVCCVTLVRPAWQGLTLVMAGLTSWSLGRGKGWYISRVRGVGGDTPGHTALREQTTSLSSRHHERNCAHPSRPVWQPDRSQGQTKLIFVYLASLDVCSTCTLCTVNFGATLRNRCEKVLISNFIQGFSYINVTCRRVRAMVLG